MIQELSTNPIANFSKGFFYPFRGARLLLRYPGLIKYILIPFVINVLVFTAAVYLGFDLFNDVIVGLIPDGGAWYWAVLRYLFWFLALLVTAVLVFFSFTVVGNVIASPFNDVLSERTEQKVVGALPDASFSLRECLREGRRVFFEELKKIGLFVLIMLLLLLLNLIPVLGQVLYSVFAVLFTLFFLVVEYLGYIMSRKQIPFRQQRQFIWSHKVLSFGFGVGVLCLLAVPLMQFLSIPFSVIGGTLFFLEMSRGNE